MLVGLPIDEMTFGVEEIVDVDVHQGEFLQGRHSSEPQHRSHVDQLNLVLFIENAKRRCATGSGIKDVLSRGGVHTLLRTGLIAGLLLT